MSTAFKTLDQMKSLAAKHLLNVEEIVPGEYRLTDIHASTRGLRTTRVRFQGTLDRCGDFLQGYDQAPK